MNTIPYERERDYPWASGWWITRGIQPPPTDHLPHGTIAIDHDKGPVAIAFALPVQDAPLVWISFIIGNPTMEPRVVHDGIISAVNDIASRHPGKTIFASFANGLVPTLERCGFFATERDKTELVRMG